MPTKNQHLQIRVSSEEKTAIKRAAKNSNSDISSWVLSKLFPPAQQQFQSLSKALSAETDASYLFAEVNDFLTELPATAFSLAVSEPPELEYDRFEGQYLAAMVELAAQQKQVNAPEWTALYQGMREPYFGSSLQSLRLHLLLNSPLPFRCRNIFIDASIGDRV